MGAVTEHSEGAFRRLTIFTGSATGADLIYQRQVRTLGAALARADVELVYGGGRVGLMGQAADAVLEVGGQVHGVIPEVLVQKEIGHTGLTRLEVVADMHARKTRMAELGDGFIALPGGMGTLEEFFEVWTWQYLDLHRKPVGLYNIHGFWNPLLSMVDHMVSEGFMAQWRRDALVISEEPEDLIVQLRSWRPPED